MSKNSVAAIKDFTGGQFYILEPQYQMPNDLKNWLKIATSARKHWDELSDWERHVVTRLCTEIPTILATFEARHE